MAIPRSIQENEINKFVESASVPGIPSVAVVNPDGTSIGTITAGGDGAIVDGASSSIKATVKDLTNSNPVTVAIVDGAGDQITSFGGGTQYTEGDTDASITGTALMFESNTGTSALSAVSNATPLPVSDAGGTLTVDGTVAVTNADITTIAGAVSGAGFNITQFNGTGVLSYAPSDTDNNDTAIVVQAENKYWNSSTSKWARMKGDATDGLLVNLGANNDVTITGTVTVGSHAVTNAGTFAVQVDGSALTSLQLIDDPVATTASAIPSKGMAISGTDGTNARIIKTDTSGELQVDVLTLPSLPAGTNAIGKLSANSGVDIGDVDITSIAAGTNNIGQVSVAPQTANGLSVFNATSSDGATALTSTAQAIKASAGQLYGWYIYNPNSSAAYVQLYNTAAASVTVGTTNPLFMLTIPATSAANVEFTNGITFSNAGWSCSATSTAGGNGAPTTALDAVFFYK